MKKGDIITGILVESMGSEGKCVARHNGQVIFLSGAAPGDTVSARLTKIKKQYLEATVDRIEKMSSIRVNPLCSHFGQCGGCSWQHIAYTEQLQYKQQQVIDHLTRIGGIMLPTVQPILGSNEQFYYRNKLDFTGTANRWMSKKEFDSAKTANLFENGLGYHLPRMFDRVFDVETCYLQADPSNAIRKQVKAFSEKENIPFFNLRKQTGFLRTLTIRTTSTGEVMIILQVAYDHQEWIKMILSDLMEKFPSITSANYVINEKRNDTFSDLNVICYQGTSYITEQMTLPNGDRSLRFHIGPKSFYQTNSLQAQVLYKEVWKMAQLKGHEIVYDLYTGIGTIASYLAADAQKVIGIDYIDEAIQDAKTNAEINQITNTHFLAGDIKDLLNESLASTYANPDIVITDPPRSGMHGQVIQSLLKIKPEKIIYVSCNPATQARDLSLLADVYEVIAVQPVDMFPHTVHVENIVQLNRKQSST